MSKYSRLYCKECKLVHGIGSMGYLDNCTECGKPLVLKSFNPWLKIGGGIAIISVGVVTILFTEIPIVWIGAFIWGGSMIHSGRKQWAEVTKLDFAQDSLYREPGFVDSKQTAEEHKRIYDEATDMSSKPTAKMVEQRNQEHKEKIAMHFCPSCGNKLTGKMAFCVNCGRKLKA